MDKPLGLARFRGNALIFSWFSIYNDFFPLRKPSSDLFRKKPLPIAENMQNPFEPVPDMETRQS